MKFTLSIVSIVLAACQLGTAAPAGSTSNGDNTSGVSNGDPAPGTVTYCIGPAASPCHNVVVKNAYGKCTPVIRSFQNKITKIQPAIDVTCDFYKDPGCDGDWISVEYPGYDHISQNSLNSFRCYPN